MWLFRFPMTLQLFIWSNSCREWRQQFWWTQRTFQWNIGNPELGRRSEHSSQGNLCLLHGMMLFWRKAPIFRELNGIPVKDPAPICFNIIVISRICRLKYQPTIIVCPFWMADSVSFWYKENKRLFKFIYFYFSSPTIRLCHSWLCKPMKWNNQIWKLNSDCIRLEFHWSTILRVRRSSTWYEFKINSEIIQIILLLIRKFRQQIAQTQRMVSGCNIAKLITKWLSGWKCTISKLTINCRLPFSLVSLGWFRSRKALLKMVF